MCGDQPTIKELIDYEAFCGITRGQASQGQTDQEQNLEPEDLKAMLDRGEKFVLLDVRESHEYDIVHIDGSKLIPLSELHLRTSELDTADAIVTYCHHGQRSAQAIKTLEHFGFKKLKHLRGGVDAWAIEVDSELARY